MATKFFVQIPTGREQGGVHEFDTFMKGVTFLSVWSEAEKTAGRSVPDIQITKVKPQQTSASGQLLPWVVIDPALDNKYGRQHDDPTRWKVVLPVRETAQRVYARVTTYGNDYVRTEAAFKRFATQEEAEAFKAAAVAVWNTHAANVQATSKAEEDARTAARKARGDQLQALCDHLSDKPSGE